MKIFVVSVAHVSRKSAQRVSRIINKIKPDIVAVELDEQRLRALSLKKRNPPSIHSPLLFLFFLVQQFIGRIFNAVPGSEMLSAIRTAKKHKIPLVPVDRNIHTTFKKFSQIPLSEKAVLLLQVPFAPLAILKLKQDGIDSLLKHRALFPLMEEFKKKLPYTYAVFIEERDEFIAEKVFLLRDEFETAVLVVGAGHARGVLARLEQRFKSNNLPVYLKAV